MISRSRGSLFKDQSFGESDNAYTKAGKWPAGGTLQAKEEVGRGGGARHLLSYPGTGHVVQSIATGMKGSMLKKQPVQTLYDFSNQIVPRACFPDGIRVSNLLGVTIN